MLGKLTDEQIDHVYNRPDLRPFFTASDSGNVLDKSTIRKAGYVLQDVQFDVRPRFLNHEL
jgi:hypothetical protein